MDHRTAASRRRRNMPLEDLGPLSTARIVIRPVDDTDLADLLAVNGDPQVVRHLPYVAWRSPADAQAWLGRMRALEASGSGRQFVLAGRDGGRAIGTVLLATEEVESGLARVRHGQHRLVALQEQARQAGAAQDLARKRFAAGGTDLLELLDAQRSAQRAEIGLLAAMTDQRQQIVAPQRALGARFVPEAAAAAPTWLATAAGTAQGRP